MTEKNPYAPPEGELMMPGEDRAGRPPAREVLNRMVGESWCWGGLWAAAGILIMIVVAVFSKGVDLVVLVVEGAVLGRSAWHWWWGHRSKARLMETGFWDGALATAGMLDCLKRFFRGALKELVILLFLYVIWDRWLR